MRLLIADDDAEQRRTLAEAFSAAGSSTILHARDAEETVELAAHQQPDAIVLDAVLPGASAAELITRLRTRSPKSFIVVFATPNERRFVIACRDAGADAYVLKSTPVIELVQRTRLLVDLWHQRPDASAD